MSNPAGTVFMFPDAGRWRAPWPVACVRFCYGRDASHLTLGISGFLCATLTLGLFGWMAFLDVQELPSVSVVPSYRVVFNKRTPGVLFRWLGWMVHLSFDSLAGRCVCGFHDCSPQCAQRRGAKEKAVAA